MEPSAAVGAHATSPEPGWHHQLATRQNPSAKRDKRDANQHRGKGGSAAPRKRPRPVNAPKMPNATTKPAAIAAVAARARPSAYSDLDSPVSSGPARNPRRAPPRPGRRVHREATGIERRHQAGAERQAHQFLVHGARGLPQRATRSASSCCGHGPDGVVDERRRPVRR